MPYTPEAIGRFLGGGWILKGGQVNPKIDDALTALQYIEEGTMKLDDFKDKSAFELRAIIRAARAVRKEREQAAKEAQEYAEVCILGNIG